MRNLIDIIGKQVWVLVDNCGHGIYHIDKSSKRVVVGIVKRGENFPDGTENTDWYDHLVLQNEDGTSTHIKEYEAIICPENYDDECSIVSRFLSDNRCYADEVWHENEIAVAVSINWGDWKHDHRWCEDLMGYLGYGELGCDVTEEDGSDCYSAVHYFVKTA